MKVEVLPNGNKIFISSNGKKFNDATSAANYEKYLVAREKIKLLRPHGEDWFLVRSNEDIQDLFIVASYGEWDRDIPCSETYPCWVRIGYVYQDSNNYWNSNFQVLTFEDLRDMLFGKHSKLSEV